MIATITILLAVYFAILLLIGIFSRRRARTGVGHAIASYRASVWRVAASLFTLLGGGELIAMTSLSYSFSYAAMWFFGGYAAGFLTLAIVVPRVFRSGHVREYTGLPDLFHDRFGPLAGSTASFLVILAFGSLLMIQFIAGAGMLSSFLNWPYSIVVLCMSAIIVLYLSVGGFEAVLDTDVLQAVVMLFIGGLFLYSGLSSLSRLPGGAGHAALHMPAITSSLFFIPAFLAVLSSADIWQVLFSARTEATARWGSALAALGFTGFGLLLSYFGNLTRLRVPGLANPDDAFATAIGTVFSRSLLPWGIILIFAAVMSTADTEIFVVTRTIVREVSRRTKKKLDLDAELGLTKAMISYVALSGSLLAIFAHKGSISLMYFSVVGLALALSPSMIALLRFAPPGHAVATSLILAPVVLIVMAVLGRLTPISAPIAAGLAALIGLVAGWLVPIQSRQSRRSERT